jgi:hypothetical protein
MEHVLLLGLIAASFVCWLWMSTLSEGPKRGQAKLVATLLMGAAFISSASLTLVRIHQSARDNVTGVVQNLIQRHGKNSSSSFEIQPDKGRQIVVHAMYDGSNLFNGESVHAEVLRYRGTLLNLYVRDGRFAGWQHAEGDGTLGACLSFALGSFFLIFGVRKWRAEPDAPEVPDYRTPANGIDEQSLLHLNRDQD